MTTKPIVLSMGDPSGISGEIVIKTWLDRKKENLHPFFVCDNTNRIKKLARHLSKNVPIKEIKSPTVV